MRMNASWSWVFAARRIQGCGAMLRARSGLPSDRHPGRIECAIVLGPVNGKPLAALKKRRR